MHLIAVVSVGTVTAMLVGFGLEYFFPGAVLTLNAKFGIVGGISGVVSAVTSEILYD